MERRPLAEGAVELAGVHARDRAGVESADAPLELERPREGLLHRDLLVEDEADEERERLLGEERVGLVVAGEVEPGRCSGRHVPILAPDASSAYLLLSDALPPSGATISLLGSGWEEGRAPNVWPKPAPVGVRPRDTLKR